MRVPSPYDPSTAIYCEVHGDGVPLLLGFPLLASHGEVFSDAGAAVLAGYLERLTDRYRVLLVDHPSIGRSDAIPPSELTADRVCGDLLAVADAAGFGRFAYWGYSWGGAVGLQLAARTDRLSALVVGGWPPLGGPYDGVLAGVRIQLDDPPASAMVVLRGTDQYAQWMTFYNSLRGWSEQEALAAIACPRLVFTAADGDSDAGGVPLPLASTIRACRTELQRLGWEVREIPDRDFSVCLEPQTVVPVVREFLDRVTDGEVAT